MKNALRIARAALLCAASLTARPALAHHDGHDDGQPHLQIGVTLHPYYSWTKSVVGDTPGIEVRGLIPAEIDAGSYQPVPEDVKKLASLDAVVINGLGHDDFVLDMIRASGNDSITILRPNEGTPLLRSAHGEAANSHTFLSFSNAIQQTYAIERKLAELRPDLAETFRTNASAYAKRLRKLKAELASRLAEAKVHRVVTVHDGYSYLLQELGIELAGVVEPAHGLVPSAAELAELIELIRREKIEVVLSEQSFPEKLLETLREESGAKIYVLSHVATGPWSAEQFEREMQRNGEVLVQALVEEAGTR